MRVIAKRSPSLFGARLAGLQGKKINIPKWRGDRTVFPPFCQCYLLAITSDFAKAIVGRHNFAMVPSYLSSEFAQVEETMKVAANAVIEDGITVARCDMCGSRFYRSRADSTVNGCNGTEARRRRAHETRNDRNASGVGSRRCRHRRYSAAPSLTDPIGIREWPKSRSRAVTRQVIDCVSVTRTVTAL